MLNPVIQFELFTRKQHVKLVIASALVCLFAFLVSVLVDGIQLNVSQTVQRPPVVNCTDVPDFMERQISCQMLANQTFPPNTTYDVLTDQGLLLSIPTGNTSVTRT